MPRFTAFLDVNVTISANSKDEADKILDKLDVIAFIRGEPEGPMTLKYKIDYPVDITNWRLEEGF